MSWADAAAAIVAEVILRVGRSDMKALRKALTEAYPWGERDNTPYKAWLAENRRQLGHPLNAPKADPANTQTEMFNRCKENAADLPHRYTTSPALKNWAEAVEGCPFWRP